MLAVPLSVMLLLAATPASIQGPTPDWKVVSDGADGSQLSTDATSLDCKAGVCSASERTTYLKPLATGATVIRDQVQYDCAKALTRTLSEDAYDAGGVAIAHLAGASPWAPVELGAVGFESLRFACSRGAETAVERPASAVAKAPAVVVRTAVAVIADGAVAAQVVASPTEAGARSTLAAIIRKTPGAAQLHTDVKATRGPHGSIYRASFSGFASKAQANIFCASLARFGQDCLVETHPVRR